MDISRTGSLPGLYLAGQVYERSIDDGGNYFTVSLMTSEQASFFVSQSDDYVNKACVSLNNIFVPFDANPDNVGTLMSDGNVDYTVPSGTDTMKDTVGQGLCNSMYDEINSSYIFDGNVSDGEKKYKQRSIGINRRVNFVGYNDTDENQDSDNPSTIADTRDIRKYVSGPIDMTWDSSKKMWSAGGSADIFVMKLIDAYWVYYDATDTMPPHYKIRGVSAMVSEDDILYDDVSGSGSIIPAREDDISIYDVYAFAGVFNTYVQYGYRMITAIKGSIKDETGTNIGEKLWVAITGGCA